MTVTTVSKLKASLSEFLRRVKAGEEVLVTERGRVVARLSPPASSPALPESLREMERQGLVRLGTGKLPRRFWRMPRPKDPKGARDEGAPGGARGGAVKFWDSSAVISLCVSEPTSAAMRALLKDDPSIVAWWSTRTKCVSALLRRLRDGSLNTAGVAQARAVLRVLADCGGNPPGSEIVFFDARLREAALREGFDVLPHST
jgi:prevent-host-death family protein